MVAACQAPPRRPPAPDAAPPAAVRRLPLGAPAPVRAVGSGAPARALAPLPVTPSDSAHAALRTPLVWQVPDARPALAVLSGADAAGMVTELLEIDSGVVRWRATDPSGTVVGVTATAIVGAERGTWALGLDGAHLWQTDSPFLAMAGPVVLVGAAEGKVSAIDAATGRDLMRIEVPAPLSAVDTRWACPAHGELWLIDERVGVHRVIAAADGSGPRRGQVAWTAPLAAVSVEGCQDSVWVATAPDALGRYQVLRLDRQTGRSRGLVRDVLAHWVDDSGALVTSQAATFESAGGVRRWDDALTTAERLSAEPTAERLASVGEWLVARGPAGQLWAVHAGGGAVPVAIAADSAALGERALVTAISSGSSDHTVARWRWDMAPPPPAQGWARAPTLALPPAALHVPAQHAAPAAPAAPAAEQGAAAPGVAQVGAVVATDDGVLGVVHGERGSALVRLDERGAVVWTAPGACAGDGVRLAVSGELVVCATLGAPTSGRLAAFSAETGAPRWTRELRAEALEVAGAWVLARAADRAALLSSQGAVAAQWRSDHGGPVRAALVEAGGSVVLVVEEAGVLVGRWPAGGLVPLWALAVHGGVRELSALGEHVLLSTTAREAFAVRAADGAAVAMPREAEAFFATGDGVLAVTARSGPPVVAATRLALFSVAGAVHWEYDVALPGRMSVSPSAQLGGTWLAFGELLDRALVISAEGLAAPLVLPAAATDVSWHRTLAGRRWVGLSTTAPRFWAL